MSTLKGRHYKIKSSRNSALICHSTLAVFSAHGLSGIKHYETLSYNPNYLQHQHNDLREKRSLLTSIRLQINAYNRYYY